MAIEFQKAFKAAKTANNLIVAAGQLASEQIRKKTGGDVSPSTAKRLAVLTNSKLAEPMFSAGPSDDLLAVDVLGVSDVGVLNNTAGKLTGFDPSPLDALRQQSVQDALLKADIADGVANAAQQRRKAVSDALNPIDRAPLLERIAKSIGGGGSINALSGEVQRSLLAPRTNDPSFYGRARGTINQIPYSFETNNFSDSRGVFDLINQLSRKIDFAVLNDLAAEGSLLTTLLCELIKSGLSDALGHILDCVDNRDVADYGLRNSIPTAVQNGDLYATNLAIDRLGVAQVRSLVPNAPGQLMSNYRFPPTTTSADHPSLLNSFVSTLDRLDPNGLVYDRGGSSASNLSIFTAMSPDANTLFQSSSSFSVETAIASSYPPADLKSELSGFYPYAPIG